MIKINFLPWRLEVKRKQQLRFLIILSFALIITGILNFYIYLTLNQKIKTQIERNKIFKNHIQQLAAKTKKYNTVQKQHKKLLQYLIVQKSLKDRNKKIILFINTLGKNLLKNIVLESAAINGSIINIEMRARKNSNINGLTNSLSKLSFLSSPKLSIIADSKNKTGKSLNSIYSIQYGVIE